MIPTFKGVVKWMLRIYPHAEVADLLNYLTAATLERGAIAEISRTLGFSHPPFATGID
jgi:hypothetical protein